MPARKIVPPKGFITSNEACSRLGISKPTLGRWAKDGKLKQHDFQNAVVYREADVVKLAASWQKATPR